MPAERITEAAQLILDYEALAMQALDGLADARAMLDTEDDDFSLIDLALARACCGPAAQHRFATLDVN
jgi:hypothetical protein